MTAHNFSPPAEGEMLRAAHAYARIGIAVAPLHFPEQHEGEGLTCSCKGSLYDPEREARMREAGKIPRCQPAKHPLTAHGFKEATTDPRMIDYWWGKRWPNANIALICGPQFNIADIDGPAGVASFKELLGDTELPPCPIARSGRRDGGWQLWFASTGTDRWVGMRPGVDWLGEGGYGIGWPSRHISGNQYHFVKDHWLGDFVKDGKLYLPEAPERIVKLLEQHQVEQAVKRTRAHDAVVDRRVQVADLTDEQLALMPRAIERALASARKRVEHARPGEGRTALLAEGTRLFSFAYAGAWTEFGDLTASVITSELTAAATSRSQRLKLGRTPADIAERVAEAMSVASEYGMRRPHLPDLDGSYARVQVAESTGMEMA